MVPFVSTGTREGSTRTDNRAAPLQLTLLDIPLHVWRGAVRCGRVAPSRPEERNNVARSSEGQAFTTGMNAWPRPSGRVQVPIWRPAVLRRRKHRRLLSTVAQTAIAAVLSTPCDVVFSRFREDQIYRSLEGRVTTATPMPEALDFMCGLTIKPS
jgi:hypothetical protein